MGEPVEQQNSASVPVGRDHEWRTLASVFRSARVGNGRMILVGGEAGIGKTTLVEYFLEQARADGATILNGACFDVSSPPAYAAWIEAFSSHHGLNETSAEALSLFDEDHIAFLSDQTALFREFHQQLTSTARENPVILVLEDLHWADQESLDLLRYIGQRMRYVPLLVIVTYRDDEIAEGQPFYDALLPLIRECGAERVDLRRLNRRDIGALVRNRYTLEPADLEHLVEALSDRSGGNPLFIVELLRSIEIEDLLRVEDGRWQLAEELDTGIPLLVRQLIERRLRQLDPAAREVLQTAAILGFEVQPEVLVDVTEQHEGELSGHLQQAVGAFLLEQPPDRRQLRFRHALVQEVLYFSSPILWRQTQHRRVAEVLAEKPGTDPAIVAQHFRYGGDARAADWSLQAARRARQLYAPHAIVQHLTPVLNDPETLSVKDRIEAFSLRGWANEMTGAFDAADQDYLAELRAALDSNDRQAERDALVRLAMLWTYRDYQRVAEYVQQALQVTEDMNDQSLLAHTQNRFGTWYMSQDDPRRAHAHHQRALKIFQSTSDKSGVAESLDLLGLSLTLSGDLSGAAQQYQRAKSQVQILNNREGLSNCLANIAHLGPTYLSDTAVADAMLDDCIRTARRALEIASEIEFRTGEVYAGVRLIACLGAHGEYQHALDTLQRSTSGAEQIGNRQLLSAGHAMAGLLWLDLFDPDLAQWHGEEARSIAKRIGSTFRIRMSTAILALTFLAQGNLDAAEKELSEICTNNSSSSTLAQHLLWRARIELELLRGNPKEALRYIDCLVGSIPNASRQRPALRISYLRGRALNGLRRYEEAESWLGPARAVAEQLGAHSLLWRIEREIGMAYLGRGNRPSASGSFAEARRLVRAAADTLADSDVKSWFLSAAISQVPKPISLTPLQAAKQSYGGLTRRQRQVAALVTAGRSNRAIAKTLSVSERTVESHVGAILSTLELDSRAQIVAWCIEHGLLEDSGNSSALPSSSSSKKTPGLVRKIK